MCWLDGAVVRLWLLLLNFVLSFARQIDSVHIDGLQTFRVV